GFGETLLSREKAKRHEAWITLEKAYEDAETVVGIINGKVKGGFTVELNGIRAFLPGSLVDVRPVRDTLHLEGKELEFKVIKLDQKPNNVVVSRRAVIESENSAERDQLLENLQEGMEVKGIVKNLTDYGAFVDLGGVDGRTLVTKNSFRFLNTLYTMGPSPEPNITILWSEKLPLSFKKYAAKVSIDTSSLQYENDDLMRPDFNNDGYAIACCVSPMVVGKQMQFFGARANLAKTMLYAINGGVDEKLKMQVGPKSEPIKGDVLNFDEVMDRMDHFMDWLAKQYVTALNIIHYMHDKYSYEASLMALHDRDVIRTMACGIAGLSVAADSLSAIKYAKVKPIRDENGLAVDFEIEGEYPQFGNNDSRVDDMAVDLVERYMKKIQKLHTYRDAIPTQSVLTITSNVVYGKKTGNTPDGRRAGAPFGPGANPMHGRDQKGAVASLTSVAKLPFAYAKDGISYTFSIVPNALGKDDEVRKTNLAGLMDGYFHHEASIEGGQHLNVNVMNREMLLDAMENPEKYPQLTIRVSGYAVRFNSLTKEQQQDVITRTFTQTM
ncbi:pyruvate formate lyase family protein, partial [Klebsiella michiganensis]